MKFKGYNFRENKSVVSIPVRNEEGNLMPYVEKGKEFYVNFGRITKLGEKKLGAIKTNYKYENSGESVYAVPIKLTGHSLTNMAYGEDRNIYLMYDGKCYTAKMKNKVDC